MESNNLLITSARLVDIEQRIITSPMEVYCANGRIHSIAKSISVPDGTPSYNIKGAWLSLGLIDTNVHMLNPGDWDEDFDSSVIASAKAGGYIGAACLPNTKHPLDSTLAVEYLTLKGASSLFNIYPIAALTENLKGEKISEMGLLKKHGAVAFSDSQNPLMNTEILRQGMTYAASLDVPVFLDCEDSFLAAGGTMHEGSVSMSLGLRGIPREAESMMISRNLILAKMTGAHLHIQSVSTKESVDLVAKAKDQNLPVTAETSPPYFTLTYEDMTPYDTFSKLRPPLRSQKDREAVRQAILDGTIDIISSSHTPRRKENDFLTFESAPFGSVGLETCLGLTLTQFADQKEDVKIDLLSKMSINPHTTMGLAEEKRMAKGCLANFTVIDPKLTWTVDSQYFYSQYHNTPFEGKKLQGRAVGTIINGKVVHSLIEQQ
ncbi:hypothetical protein AB834_00760 [PVC group bacterium (ex Bugula neritina AB1)]|nr:hypothetical protein AB834_00760 [PVC group bacterium (ex Bugula neritina AB1)]